MSETITDEKLEGGLMFCIDLHSERPSKACWEEPHNHVTLLLDDYHMILGKSA